MHKHARSHLHVPFIQHDAGSETKALLVVEVDLLWTCALDSSNMSIAVLDLY
jgi:hypothetical protein